MFTEHLLCVRASVGLWDDKDKSPQLPALNVPTVEELSQIDRWQPWSHEWALLRKNSSPRLRAIYEDFLEGVMPEFSPEDKWGRQWPGREDGEVGWGKSKSPIQDHLPPG